MLKKNKVTVLVGAGLMALVLADLIRRGELPMGDYIFNNWW